MREIPASLTAGQAGEGPRMPALSVRAHESRFGVRIPDWMRLDLTDDETHHNASVLSNGTVARIKIDPDDNHVYLLGIAPADRADPDAWVEWTDFGTDGDSGVRPAICCSAAGGTIHILWKHATSGNRVRWSYSADYGANWTSPSAPIILAGGYTVTGVAAAYRDSDGDVFCFYTYDPGGAGADDVLAFRQWDSSTATWGSEVAWSDGAKYAFEGIDVYYDGDFNVVAAGRDSVSPYDWRLWSLVYGDGANYPAGSWWAKAELERSDDLDCQFHEPAICPADTPRLAFTRRYAGTGGGRRGYISAHGAYASFGDNYWVEPAALDYAPAADLGLVVRWDEANDYLYLIGDCAVWYGDLSAKHADLTDYVVGYDYREGPAGGGLTLVLDNAGGELADAGVVGSEFRALRRGCTLEIQRGLRIEGTDYLAALPACIVDSLEWHTRRGESRLTVRCLDWRGWLGKWRAGRLYQWSSEACTVIGGQLLARAGLDFADKGSEGSLDMSNLTPDFVVPPGQAGDAALGRLMRYVPDVLRFDGVDTVLYKALDDDEVADYTLGGTGEHILLEASFVDGSADENAALVQGASDVYGEAHDFDEIGLLGQRARLVNEELYTTGDVADGAAAGVLSRSHVGTVRTGWVRVFPIHGLELWDVLGVTAPAAWAGTRRYRVVGSREELDRVKGRYGQVIDAVRIG